MKHRATGNPRGRPPKIPFDIDKKILVALGRRMDKESHMVRPRWNLLAREVGVSRSTISRVLPSLKAAGFIESVFIKTKPDSKVSIVFYKIKK